MQDIVSLLPHQQVFTQGLAPEAIVGRLLQPLDQGGTLSPENFARNSVFVDFLHEVIARYGPDLPGLKAEAERLGAGWLYVIDARTPTPEGDVPPYDIFGAFQVDAGVIVAGSYQRNPNHVILSPQGFFRLEPALQERMLVELAARDSGR
jgi:hypothetical protein